MSTFEHHGAGYLRKMTLAELRNVRIGDAVRDLTPHVNEFSTVVVTGYSSAISGSIIADRLNKNLVVVRKPTAEPGFDHRSLMVEGVHGEPCLFVDDFICSGNTIRRVYDGVKANGGSIVGFWLYSSQWSHYHICDDILTSFNGEYSKLPD